ncbi:hypothetical protein ASPZODRAFT_20527 [Penicilliopsis zonata CBS 506.65]|uniref:Uncharacterized protein n=1 Tax=Penicilliopsis zonata CBS 506.65 TaxID=1073090 RepID=A0A1L9S5I5_9EURO|nr:hypothetical protein ASPZODRAFT_20527 [Penicilliopsis zonata CBS 506.65]OJJ42410.1 hypothetical protein ASPZODRAFT_20527 [Penicilliopsis zonata CBS 506.65]
MVPNRWELSFYGLCEASSGLPETSIEFQSNLFAGVFYSSQWPCLISIPSSRSSITRPINSTSTQTESTSAAQGGSTGTETSTGQITTVTSIDTFFPTTQMATSTIFTTRTSTITACPASERRTYTTTDVIIVSTTVCPVTAAEATAATTAHTDVAASQPTGSGSGLSVTPILPTLLPLSLSSSSSPSTFSSSPSSTSLPSSSVTTAPSSTYTGAASRTFGRYKWSALSLVASLLVLPFF